MAGSFTFRLLRGHFVLRPFLTTTLIPALPGSSAFLFMALTIRNHLADLLRSLAFTPGGLVLKGVVPSSCYNPVPSTVGLCLAHGRTLVNTPKMKSSKHGSWVGLVAARGKEGWVINQPCPNREKPGIIPRANILTPSVTLARSLPL